MNAHQVKKEEIYDFAEFSNKYSFVETSKLTGIRWFWYTKDFEIVKFKTSHKENEPLQTTSQLSFGI